MGLQLALSGVGSGSIYALIALGFNIVFKSSGALNFAQGEWVMLGGMITAAGVGAHLPVWAASLLALGAVIAIGALSEKAVVAPLRRPTPDLVTLISIGLAVCTKSLAMLTLGKDPAGYPGFSGDAVLHVFGASIPAQTIWIVGITAVTLILAHLFFDHSVPGKAMRAVAADRDAAALVGIDVRATTTWAFAIAALVGGLAGLIITPLTFTSYDQGTLLGFKGFSAAMLGGIGSLPGAVAGGLVLGLMETFTAGYLSAEFKDAVAFVVLLVILFLRPSGLLGHADVEKV